MSEKLCSLKKIGGAGSKVTLKMQSASMSVGNRNAYIYNCPASLKYVSFIIGTGGNPKCDGVYDVVNNTVIGMRFGGASVSFDGSTVSFGYSALGGTSGYRGEAVIIYEE